MSINKEVLLYLLLGFVQGITEPLPISSSGHMVIFEHFLKLDFSDLNFKIFVNLASLLAIILYYRKFLFKIIKDFFIFLIKKDQNKKENFLYVIYIFIACIPSAIIGFFFKDYIDQYFSNILTVSLSLLFTSIILFIISYITKYKNTKKINAKNSLIIGLGQVIGLIPGVSRSGITTFFGINNKISLEDALHFSFMMYIPTSLGALILSLDSNSIFSSFNYLYLLSFISSFIGTYLGIIFFFKLVKEKNFKYFAIYLFILSILLLFII